MHMGTMGFAAQAYGSDEKVELRLAFLRPLVLALGLGLLLLAFRHCWTKPSNGRPNGVLALP
ncbi:hypothetical protein JCM14719A_16580 [Calditerricola satsumensis]|uniref:Uncharacterized protein n=1 Tax=Calditerricola satsumensis TaxID=373054 RepID=A0A8J3BE95_9BACI|nr:hypothetical protein GCM10007043_21890 [Calditerricola satsumensis]